MVTTKAFKKKRKKLEKEVFQNEMNYNEITSIIRRSWSREEFMVLCYYVLYEKQKYNDVNLVQTIADGMGRSYASVNKKISIINNIDSFNKNIHTLEREVYYDFVDNGEQYASQELDKAIEKIIENNPQ